MDNQTPLIQLKGVGEKTARLFGKLNITTVGELLNHYPRDYERFEEPVSVAQAVSGELVSVRAMVAGIPNLKKVRSLTILNVTVKDSSGSLLLTFFNMPFLKNVLKNNGYYIFRGLVQTRGAAKVIEQPRIYSLEEYDKLRSFIQPRYALTKGLSNNTVQKAVKQALSFYAFGQDYYPQWLCSQYHLQDRKEALCNIHFPKDMDSCLMARRRLAFDEFFDFILMLRKNKEISAVLPNHFPMIETSETVRFLEQMPFSLTKAQNRVWQEVLGELTGQGCMNRLIQGDVGSGKTIIAVLALLLCVTNGYQGAMMAPTEVLATQHFETVQAYTREYKLPFRPVLLVGSMTAKEKREAYELLASGEANLAIGTHALIQDKVQYRKLALVITDEQHRFGVRQRELLAAKGEVPHVLVMSATPIPRTLAIILYGDLHLSVIDELPANRLPIKNCVVNTSYRPKAYEFIARQVSEGRQAYVICPMVEEGELDDTENVVEYTQKLRAALPESIQVEKLHGKMRPADKNQIMDRFARREIDVLVSTTVIEVGINVPNATVMMVENADRFGLAQLHQLRGRVGRGNAQSYCIFISTKEKKDTMKRLEILNTSNDGFYIASEDLKLRGPGDLFGIRQSGDFVFKIGDIYTDSQVLQEASEAVDEILDKDSGLLLPEHKLLREHLQKVAGLQEELYRTL